MTSIRNLQQNKITNTMQDSAFEVQNNQLYVFTFQWRNTETKTIIVIRKLGKLILWICQGKFKRFCWERFGRETNQQNKTNSDNILCFYLRCIWFIVFGYWFVPDSKWLPLHFLKAIIFNTHLCYSLFQAHISKHYVIGQAWKNDQQMRDDSPKLLLSNSGFCMSLWQSIWMRVSANIHNVPVQCAMCTLFCSDFIVLAE